MLALADSRGLRSALELAVRRSMLISAFVGMLAVLAMLPLQVVNIAEDWHSVMDGHMLGAVAFETRFGWAWCTRVIAVAAVTLAIVLFPAGKVRLKLWLTASALLPAGLSGHAAMQEGWPGVAHAGCDMLHCLAAAFWIGSLPVFLLLLRLYEDPVRKQHATRALMRFSFLGHCAVATLLISGLVNSVFILQSTTISLASRYQELLLVKVFVAIAMVALALLNRYRWIPLVRTRKRAALRQIRRNTVLEILAGGFALALVSVFGLLSP